MNNLPDDLRAFEANLGELVPTSSLDADRLIYEAGYAAALAQCGSSAGSARTYLKMAGSVLVGIAATLLAIATWPNTGADINTVPEVETIPRVTGQQVEPSLPTPSSQLAVQPSPRADPKTKQVDISPQVNEAYSTWSLRDQLLKTDGQWSSTLEVQPVDLPANRNIKVLNDRHPTNLQWQTELFQDVSTSTRGST